MKFEDGLRECIDGHLALTGEKASALAIRAKIPATSLQRFLRKERSLKTPSIIALVEVLDLRLVHATPAEASGAGNAIERRQQEKIHKVAERARRLAYEMETLGQELDSVAFGT